MAAKKKSQSVQELVSKALPAITPEGSEAKKNISIETKVSKDDVANLIFVNVRTELNRELASVDNKLEYLTKTRKDLENKAKEYAITVLGKEGYNTELYGSISIDITTQKVAFDVHHSHVPRKPITAVKRNIKELAVTEKTLSMIENIEYTNDDIVKHCKETEDLTQQRKQLVDNINLATKDYVKATLIGSLISSSDKGVEFARNLSSITIDIINSVKKNTVPLIGIK